MRLRQPLLEVDAAWGGVEMSFGSPECSVCHRWFDEKIPAEVWQTEDTEIVCSQCFRWREQCGVV